MHTMYRNMLENWMGWTQASDFDLPAAIRRYVALPFGVFADLFRMQVLAHPKKLALHCLGRDIRYDELDDLADRIAAALQQDGVGRGGVVALCAATSIEYVAVMLGVLRTGAAFAPLPPSATSSQLLTMLSDCGAKHLFVDTAGAAALGTGLHALEVQQIALEGAAGGTAFEAFLAKPGAHPTPVAIEPDDPFNIIYSSGTTGTPKGIVQPHSMRWPQLHLLDPPGYGPDAVAIISTPLYSNTTLVSLLPALAGGGTVVLMPKFDARQFLELSVKFHATAAMLVPVQYRRILDVADFDSFDLSSYTIKYATSAPFAADLKAEVLARWPGGLVEYFGMTEGGGSCMLVAHERPDKLHTVGQPIGGHEMLVIDEHGKELPPGEAGEVVGRSTIMMTGYHNQPGKTTEAEWYSPEGDRYIRTGDVGRMDEEGFLTLIGRRKDMIISGGMNIYPSDLESVLREYPAVLEAAVIGVASERWGETPVGFITVRDGAAVDVMEVKQWANERLGKMQRLSEIRIVDELPRSAIGKVLKRELQLRWMEGALGAGAMAAGVVQD